MSPSDAGTLACCYWTLDIFQRLRRPPCGKALPFRGLPLLLFLAATPPSERLSLSRGSGMLADRTGRRSPPPRLSGSDSDLAGREAFSAGFENEPSRRGGFCPDDHQTQSVISISIRSLESLE